MYFVKASLCCIVAATISVAPEIGSLSLKKVNFDEKYPLSEGWEEVNLVKTNYDQVDSDTGKITKCTHYHYSSDEGKYSNDAQQVNLVKRNYDQVDVDTNENVECTHYKVPEEVSQRNSERNSPTQRESDETEDSSDEEGENDAQRNEHTLSMYKEFAANSLAMYLVQNSDLKDFDDDGDVDGQIEFYAHPLKKSNFKNPHNDKGRDVDTPSLRSMMKSALSTVNKPETMMLIHSVFGGHSGDRSSYLNDNTMSLTEIVDSHDDKASYEKQVDSVSRQVLFQTLKFLVTEMAHDIQKNPISHYRMVKVNHDIKVSNLSTTSPSPHQDILLVDEFGYLIYEADQIATRAQFQEYGLLPSEANIADISTKLDHFTTKEIFDLFKQYFINRSLSDKQMRGSLFVGPLAWNNFYSTVEGVFLRRQALNPDSKMQQLMRNELEITDICPEDQPGATDAMVRNLNRQLVTLPLKTLDFLKEQFNEKFPAWCYISIHVSGCRTVKKKKKKESSSTKEKIQRKKLDGTVPTLDEMRKFVLSMALKLQPLLLIIERYDLPSVLDDYAGLFNHPNSSQEEVEFANRDAEILKQLTKYSEQFTRLSFYAMNSFCRRPIFQILEKYQGQLRLRNSYMKYPFMTQSGGQPMLVEDPTIRILAHMKEMNEEYEISAEGRPFKPRKDGECRMDQVEV